MSKLKDVYTVYLVDGIPLCLNERTFESPTKMILEGSVVSILSESGILLAVFNTDGGGYIKLKGTVEN